MRLVYLAINLAKENKKNLLLWGGFLVLGLAFPVFEAYALCPFTLKDCEIVGEIAETVAGFATGMLLAIPTFILTLLQTITGLLAVLTGIIMDQVLRLAIEIRYIPGETEDAVTVGWTIMRDLANMALILVLAAIGIGAILGKNVEQLGSRIATFIGVALLINFTPVITGIIIDFSNILTKLFFDSVTGGWRLFFKETAGSFMDLTKFFELDKEVAMNLIVSAIVGIIFNIVTMAAFALVSILLIARIVALWLLVILSPIVFVAYILPQTKRLFTSWWKNFWQWSIIGIPLGFFLFLSMTIKAKGAASCGTGEGLILENLGGEVLGIVEKSGFLMDMCGSIIQIIALGVLFAGFFITFQLSAAGSNMIMSRTKQLGQWGKKQLTSPKNLARAGRIGMAANMGVTKAALRAARSPRKTMRAARKAGVLGTIRGAAGAGRKIAGELLTPEERRAVAERGRALTGKTTKKEIEDALKRVEVDKKDPKKLRQWIDNPSMAASTKQAARMALAREHPEEFTKYAKDNRSAAAGMFKDAKRTMGGKDKDGKGGKNQLEAILKNNPQFAEEFEEEIGESLEESVMKLTQNDTAKLSKEALGNKKVAGALMHHPSFGRIANNLVNNAKFDELDAFSNGIKNALPGNNREERLKGLAGMIKNESDPRKKIMLLKAEKFLKGIKGNGDLASIGFFDDSPPKGGASGSGGPSPDSGGGGDTDPGGGPSPDSGGGGGPSPRPPTPKPPTETVQSRAGNVEILDKFNHRVRDEERNVVAVRMPGGGNQVFYQSSGRARASGVPGGGKKEVGRWYPIKGWREEASDGFSKGHYRKEDFFVDETGNPIPPKDPGYGYGKDPNLEAVGAALSERYKDYSSKENALPEEKFEELVVGPEDANRRVQDLEVEEKEGPTPPKSSSGTLLGDVSLEDLEAEETPPPSKEEGASNDEMDT